MTQHAESFIVVALAARVTGFFRFFAMFLTPIIAMNIHFLMALQAVLFNMTFETYRFADKCIVSMAAGLP